MTADPPRDSDHQGLASAPAFLERLTSLHEVATLLSDSESLDALCRKAVELGRDRLGFDRIGLWLTTDTPMLMAGTFGTDERGATRDERASRVWVSSGSLMGQVLLSLRPSVRIEATTLYDDAVAEVGEGAHAIASLWDGRCVIGCVSVDNFLRRQPITTCDCRLLELYASMIGHMCTRRRHLTALAESESRYRAIVEDQTDLICRYLPDGGLTFANEALCRYFGKLPAEIVGSPFTGMVHEGDRDVATQAMSALGDALPVINVDLRARTPSGEVRWLHWTIRTIPATANVAKGAHECQGVGRDVTERVRLQNQLFEVSHAEQQRIGRALHDALGQELTGIGFLAKALETRLARQGLPEAENARQIANLVTEALGQTRRIAHGLSPVDLNRGGLAVALRTLAQGAACAFGIDCTYRGVGRADTSDETVVTHLYLIAQEALCNAVKCGKAERVRFRLSRHGGVARLTVTDNGAGFDPRSPETRTGLGLSSMRYRAQAIGGTFRIKSRPGKGTEVICTFTLPASAGAVA